MKIACGITANPTMNKDPQRSSMMVCTWQPQKLGAGIRSLMWHLVALLRHGSSMLRSTLLISSIRAIPIKSYIRCRCHYQSTKVSKTCHKLPIQLKHVTPQNTSSSLISYRSPGSSHSSSFCIRQGIIS